MGNTSFELPSAYCEIGEAACPSRQAQIAAVEAHLTMLARQDAFHKLRGAVRSNYPSLRAFTLRTRWDRFEDEAEWFDFEPMEYVDAAGVEREVVSLAGAGHAEGEPDMDPLRRVLGEMPAPALAGLEGERVDCMDDRAIACAVMGAEGFAAFEAEALGRTAGTARGGPPRSCPSL